MLLYTTVHDVLGVDGYKQVLPHTSQVHKFSLSRNLGLSVSSRGYVMTCLECALPIPPDHMALSSNAEPLGTWHCWECVEEAYLAENPNAPEPPRLLDQFRDNGRD